MYSKLASTKMVWYFSLKELPRIIIMKGGNLQEMLLIMIIFFQKLVDNVF